MKIRLILTALSLLFSFQSFSEDLKFDRIVSVYDGDTFKVQIDNLPKIFGDCLPIRVRGVDSPEMKSNCLLEKKLAKLAKAYTTTLLQEAKTIEIKNISRDKYFRITADVFVDGCCLAKELIQKGFGRSYFGDTRGSWEKEAKKYFEMHPEDLDDEWK